MTVACVCAASSTHTHTHTNSFEHFFFARTAPHDESERMFERVRQLPCREKPQQLHTTPALFRVRWPAASSPLGSGLGLYLLALEVVEVVEVSLELC